MRAPNAEEQASGVPLTQFGHMCAALDIRIIAARSPQAKGRVERNHGTHQDRLVKKLRRLGIADAPTANAFLETTYLPEHNRRFAVAPASAEDFHRRAPSRTTLDQVFQLEDRVLSNDWVVRYDTRYFQVARQSGYAPACSTVTVREARDGALELRYRGRLLPWTEIAAPIKRPVRPPRSDEGATQTGEVAFLGRKQDHVERHHTSAASPSWPYQARREPLAVARRWRCADGQ